MPAYYSEYDKNAAAWLRELIKRGLIADGEVDERDLWDVAPIDLTGFTQVHLCAGIGVWSYALRQAGWPDDRPVWTGSFPCQPYSAAGKRKGFADERHLWPAGYHLVEFWRPRILFGEQVASKDAEPWLDLVQADMEALGYAVGAVPFPSAGVGAPHIRDRLYWVADAASAGREWRRAGEASDGRHTARCEPERLCDAGGGLADPELQRRRLGQSGREDAADAAFAGETSGLADADGGHPGAERQQRGGEQRQQPQDGGVGALADASEPRRPAPRQHERGEPQLSARPAEHGGVGGPAGPTNGLWRDADWLLCRDGKWRPVEPGTFPLAHGAPARVGCVCAACLEASAEGANDEDLRALRKVAGPADRRVSAQILQPGMPMAGASQDAKDEGGRALAGSTLLPEHDLRKLWRDGGEPSASQGPRSDEQQPDEHPDTLPQMSQCSPSCERCGSKTGLYEVIITGNSRVSRLRGYGNAIVAPAAQAWIESYLEATGERAFSEV